MLTIDLSGKVALVNVFFDIREEDPYRVGRIDIRGNMTTQSRVIRRELRLYPQQLFDTVAVEATFRSRVLKLPRQEFQLLKFLAVGAGRAMAGQG